MSVLQRVLRPVAFVAGAHARSEARRFVEAQRHVRQTQDELLRRLIDSSRGSQFHADHSLGTVRTYEEFVRAVPLRDCESLRPYMDQVYNGHPEALFAPGTAISMFAITSGTTGEPKHIPVTQEFMRAYRRGWNGPLQVPANKTEISYECTSHPRNAQCRRGDPMRGWRISCFKRSNYMRFVVCFSHAQIPQQILLCRVLVLQMFA